MEKIMFNDRYELTAAVLERKKTMTRRVMNPQPDRFEGSVPIGIDVNYFGISRPINPKYTVGEIVAVAQSYGKIGYSSTQPIPNVNRDYDWAEDTAGWNNKMFVRAELMPHQIRITSVRAERLQDISEEDCLKEGINIGSEPIRKGGHFYYFDDDMKDERICFDTPREAFSALIDKISGKGTCESNPWVWVYEFELIK